MKSRIFGSLRRVYWKIVADVSEEHTSTIVTLFWLSDPEHGETTVLRNVCSYVPVDTTQHNRSTEDTPTSNFHLFDRHVSLG